MNKRAVILVVGDSGSGKTSLLASAANAGFKLGIIDFENKLSVLRSHLTEEGAKNVSFITLKDDILGKATAAKGMTKILEKGWIDGDQDFGGLEDWGPDTILCIDGITRWGEALKHEALSQDGQKQSAPLSPALWGDSTRAMWTNLDYLTSDYLTCNVVFTALPQIVDDDRGISKLYPACVTKNFSTQVGGFMDNVVMIGSKRDGSRFIRTVSDNKIELKTTASNRLEQEVPADLGALIKALIDE